jgi:hypothetical protein
MMNVQFGLWTRDLVGVSPSADVCANIFVFVAISSQKGQLEMKICKTIFSGRFSVAKSRPEFKQHRQIYSKQWFKSAFFCWLYIQPKRGIKNLKWPESSVF